MTSLLVVFSSLKDLAKDKRDGHSALVALLLEPLKVFLGDAKRVPLFALTLHGSSFLNHPQEYNTPQKTFNRNNDLYLTLLDYAV